MMDNRTPPIFAKSVQSDFCPTLWNKSKTACNQGHRKHLRRRMTQRMKNIFDRLADAFGEIVTNKVTIAELIRRKSSVVLYDGKLYRITVEEIEVATKP